MAWIKSKRKSNENNQNKSNSRSGQNAGLGTGQTSRLVSCPVEGPLAGLESGLESGLGSCLESNSKGNPMKNDDFGDRMKSFEAQICDIKLLPQIPIIARLDGKNFSKFTRGLKRPYDERLSKLMIKTTKYLVKETNANCGYTQSDEISLLFENKTEINYNRRIFKLISELSCLASLYFNRELPQDIPEKAKLFPRFDCRIYNVPNEVEAVNSFIWREADATKNSITMAASEYYSHKDLMNKKGIEKKEMLIRKGIYWDEYPDFFKRGTYVQRRKELIAFSTEEIEKLPLEHMARTNPDFKIERTIIREINLPQLSKIDNKKEVLFNGQDPQILEK